MPVPFGISIGDFIASIDITVRIVNALKDCTGSSKEYQGVIRELESLRLALVEVQNVKTDDPQTKAALNSVISNCQQTIQDFLTKVQKYDISLGSAADSHKLKNNLRKIQWALYSRDDVRGFQMQILSHATSLNLLMARINHNTAATEQMRQSSSLFRIESKLDRERRQVAVKQALIFSAITRYWKDLQAMMTFIILSNLRIFDIMIGYSRIPPQPTFDEPVRFQDAHGRILPIQMVWIDNWEHFETMLKWKFSDVPGLRKVETGHKQCGLWYSRIKPSKGHGQDKIAIAGPGPANPSNSGITDPSSDCVAHFARVRIFEIENESITQNTSQGHNIESDDIPIGQGVANDKWSIDPSEKPFSSRPRDSEPASRPFRSQLYIETEAFLRSENQSMHVRRPSPTSVRRKMISDELSDKLRKNLLWERRNLQQRRMERGW
ncbi:MAG: hypothetical protein M1820_001593 [Bogoriella megaspora]|nr:MAG: hypothetical protein M1820_001593 [Bogoriella megaspora]